MKKLTVLLLLILTGTVITEGFYIHNLQNPSIKEPSNIVQEQNTILDKIDEKRESLKKSAILYLEANNSKDWSMVYNFIPQSIKEYATKEQFVSYSQKNSDTALSILLDANIDGEKGVITTCNSKYPDTEDLQAFDWLKKNPDHPKTDRVKGVIKSKFGTDNIDDILKSIDINDKTLCGENPETFTTSLVYINGKWQFPDPETPSERSLKAASYMYTNSSSKQQKEFRDNNSFGSDSVPLTIKNLAINLDENPEKLSYVESIIEQLKIEKNRPVVNYEIPSFSSSSRSRITDDMPSSSTSKSILNDDFPRHCTSNSIGSYTYTDCY